ncbi:hypothetical protein [Litchfieldia alkalitelluris]|uniref:hypothetical protein n=1 Tax=Litchfieldia alkalitelluris TaxID=304268 RepID=UPI0009985F95|nr:hypothetical protein [Litchfieldia alkalitelluris]
MNFLFVLGVFILLIFFDYKDNKSFNWIENGTQAIIVVIIYSMISWLVENTKSRYEKERNSKQ